MRRQRNLLGPLGMGGMVSLWGAATMIKSVQQGGTSFVTSGTATINSVNLANSFVAYTGLRTTDTTTALGRIQARCELTNATTVTSISEDNVATKSLRCVVIEFAPGVVRSVQRGTITISAGVAATATITAVDVNKALLMWGNQTTSSATNNTCFATLVVTNGTTLPANMDGVGSTNTGYTVVEFF